MTKYELNAGPRTFLFDCERVEQGTAINPVLPAGFDDTDNKDRPAQHLAWWNVPYILEHQMPNGTFYELRCLNGGAWDRPTWCGTFPTLAIALEEVPNATMEYGEACRTRSHRLETSREMKDTAPQHPKQL